MPGFQYDLLVIGSGPAGESAAINAAKNDLAVAVIEQQPAVGGNCTHRGTIPSKVLRHAVQQWQRAQRSPILKDFLVNPVATYPAMLDSLRSVVRIQVNMRHKFYIRNRIELVSGSAEFEDAHTVLVRLANGGQRRITAGKIVIAVGASPYRPAGIDFDHPRVYDSDTILSMEHTPRKLIIFGAGVIGCEYASIFSGLSVKVELVNTRQRLLEFLDDEISDALGYHLRDTGVMVRHREEFERLETGDRGITLHLASGKRLHADALLWCNGRTGNTHGLRLEAAGLAPDGKGLLAVDRHYRTAIPHIFAAGDVIGWPSLASAAYNQGRFAAESACGSDCSLAVEDVATGIYTLPEISSVGRTERELTEARIPYEVGRAFFKDTARGQISGESVGMLKILFHPTTLQVQGIHCFGAEATEIIHIGQAIMNQPGSGNTVQYFVTTTFNYPTMAEAYRIAALNGLNRLER